MSLIIPSLLGGKLGKYFRSRFASVEHLVDFLYAVGNVAHIWLAALTAPEWSAWARE